MEVQSQVWSRGTPEKIGTEGSASKRKSSKTLSGKILAEREKVRYPYSQIKFGIERLCLGSKKSKSRLDFSSPLNEVHQKLW